MGNFTPVIERGFFSGFRFGLSDDKNACIEDESLLLMPQRVYDNSNAVGYHKAVSVIKACATVPLVPILLVANLIKSVAVLVFGLFYACFWKNIPSEHITSFQYLKVACGHLTRALLQLTIIGEVVLLAISYKRDHIVTSEAVAVMRSSSASSSSRPPSVGVNDPHPLASPQIPISASAPPQKRASSGMSVSVPSPKQDVASSHSSASGDKNISLRSSSIETGGITPSSTSPAEDTMSFSVSVEGSPPPQQEGSPPVLAVTFHSSEEPGASPYPAGDSSYVFTDKMPQLG